MAAFIGIAALLAGGLALLWGAHLATEAVVVSRTLSVTAWLLIAGIHGGGTVLLVTVVGLAVGVAAGGVTGRVRRGRRETEVRPDESEAATADDSFEGTAFEPAVTLEQATGSDTRRDTE
jgi:hypothetical protein